MHDQISGRRVYGGLSPEERRENRRRRLLDAALALFGTKGFAQTTIEELCSTASVSTRHFYESVRGRDELLCDLYEGIVLDLVDRIVAAQAREPAFEAWVRAGIATFITGLMEDERKARIVLIEVNSVGLALDELRQRFIDAFITYTSHATRHFAAEGVIAKRDWRLSAVALVGAINELLIGYLRRIDDRPPLEGIIDEATRLTIAGMRESRP